MGGGNSPLYKEPFVYWIGEDGFGWVAVYVSGGVVKVLRDFQLGSDGEEAYYLTRLDFSSGASFSDIRDKDGQFIAFIRNLVSLYGEIAAVSNVDEGTFNVLGRDFDIADLQIEASFDLFDFIGLCEGVINIFDEEQESVIAAGAYCNGLLHLFSSVDENGVERANCVIGLDPRLSQFPTFRETFENTGLYWGASELGYDKAAVTQLLTSRGVNVVWHTAFQGDTQFSPDFTLHLDVSETGIYK